ncbi:MAG: dTDP-4-dehydrorhamnose reductase [Victivallales bacterium]|nr:dTDP-4-dehydrorhamnose reductase [Victivallales bacterium]MCF7889255.1 dTDP-4-dehydrorhamnose reductase [Victivallales bacterium]
MKILITGAGGQLGIEFQKLFKTENIEFTATDYNELDICNKDKIDVFLKKEKFSHIINCAAYNNVDKAETDQENCFALNFKAPEYLAEKAKGLNAVFVTYSSDFIFDGKKGTPYKETDKPNPLSIYGKSKLDGEKAVLTKYNKSFVIRTSWVFGRSGQNFNNQVIKWSKDKKDLYIVDDQISAPTYSYDLALYSWLLLKTNKFGLYHLTNKGHCSKKEQAEYLLKQTGRNGTVNGVKTSSFNLPAARPLFSKLDSNKLENTINKKIPSWQNAIDRYLKDNEVGKS